MNEESIHIPLLNKQNRLFKIDSDWWNNACLNFTKDGWYLYAQGYKRAADLLILHVEEHHQEQNTIVYPAVFLYRQYLELTFKLLIRDWNLLHDQKEEIPIGHNLLVLWQEVKSLLNSMWEHTVEEREIVENHIKEFIEADPFATAFRYPADMKGNPSLPSLKHINLRNLRVVIDTIYTFLESAGLGIVMRLKQKKEIESEV